MRKRDSEKEYEHHKKWINNNRDYVNKYYRDYYENNKERMRESGKERTRRYRMLHKDDIVRKEHERRSKPEYKAVASINRKLRYELNKDTEKMLQRRLTWNRKMEVLYWYSNGTLRCNLCGDYHIEFLEVDHINNDGYVHRKEIGGSKYYYRWLIDNEFPYGFQVLCRNCNIKKVKRNAIGLKETSTPLQKFNYYNHLSHRLRSISYYSNGTNKCECCGNTDIETLCIDHIDGGGNAHRKSINTNLTQWLVKNNFPDGFRVLCENCNKSLGLYGYCPHQLP